ncbi:MAG: DnaB-like helicase N-terminal domain-containing protein [Mycobacteriales bacterium]
MIEDLERAERAVVGSLIIAPDATFTAADAIRPADFADPVCTRIFTAAARLREGHHAVDEVTLAVTLARSGDLRAAREVRHLAAEVPSPASAGYYAAHVLARSIRRQVLAAGQRLAGAYSSRAEDSLELARRERAQIDAGLQRWRTRPSSARAPLSLPAETRLPLRTPNRSERAVGDVGRYLVERVTVGTLLLSPERLRGRRLRRPALRRHLPGAGRAERPGAAV